MQGFSMKFTFFYKKICLFQKKYVPLHADFELLTNLS